MKIKKYKFKLDTIEDIVFESNLKKLGFSLRINTDYDILVRDYCKIHIMKGYRSIASLSSTSENPYIKMHVGLTEKHVELISLLETKFGELEVILK